MFTLDLGIPVKPRENCINRFGEIIINPAREKAKEARIKKQAAMGNNNPRPQGPGRH
ncbi:MAG: hypothetical protein K6E28_03710 [Eubacterium sp.]|nr:hypothetical protein [Eubacterium sp.]